MRDEKGRFINGHGFTSEMLEKMSDAKIGKPTWNKGVPMTEEHRKKFSKQLGKEPWNKGIKTGVNLNKRKGEEQICPCGNKFYIPQCRIKNGRKFCSRSCYYKFGEFKNTFKAGNKHPAWIDGNCGNGYTFKFNPALKRKIKERDNYTCQLCGITETEHKEKFNRALCVNHIDFDKSNCVEDNLNTLCNACNIKINWNREFYTNYFKNKIT